MRIVGPLNRTEFELDPREAWRRARLLDAWLSAAGPPRAHGIVRGTHAAMAQQDAARMVAVARRINRR